MFEKSFIEACLAGEASLNNLDDYVEYWHTHDTGNKLHEFLGLTSEEYARWLKVDAKEWLQDILDARGEAVLVARERPHIYLSMDSSTRVWSADVPLGRVDKQAVLFCEEKEYPVEFYYVRTDVNGSGSLEMDVCNNRKELLESLNWCGECGYTPWSFWEFSIERTCNERVTDIFAAASERRHEEALQSLEDVIEAAESQNHSGNLTPIQERSGREDR